MLKKILFTTLKVLGWIIGSILFLFVLIVLLIQLPFVQQFITEKAVASLEKKLNTEVSIGKLYIDFPKEIVLEELYIEDQQQDTLAYVGLLSIDIPMWELFSKKVQIDDVELKHVTARIQRTMPDSVANYDFITDAFSSPDTTTQAATPKDTTASPWQITLGDFIIEDIKLTYDDQVLATYVDANIGRFNIDMNSSETKLDSMRFYINEAEAKDIAVVLNITHETPPTPEDTTETPPLDLHTDLLKLTNVKFDYNSLPDNMEMHAYIGQGEATPKKIDLPNQKVAINALRLFDSYYTYVLHRDSTLFIEPDTANIGEAIVRADSVLSADKKEETTTADTSAGWQVVADVLELRRDSFAFHNYQAQAEPRGIDFNHLVLDSLEALIQDIYYDENNIKGDIMQLAANDTSGFVLDTTHMLVDIGPNVLTVQETYLKTNNSLLKPDVKLEYTGGIAGIADNLAKLKILAVMNGSTIGLRDILYFAPDLSKQPPFNNYPNGQVYMTGLAKGTIDDLYVESLRMQTAQRTSFSATGRITGLPNVDNMYFDLPNLRITTSRQDIKMLAGNLVPETINIPASLLLTANLHGSINNFQSRLALNSTAGDIAGRLAMQNLMGDVPAYNTQLDIDQLRLGYLLKQDTLLGKFTADIDIKGRGFATEDLHADAEMNIALLELNDYPYNNIKVNGLVDGMEFNGKIAANDSNLVFNFNGDVNLNNDVPEYQFQLDLKAADLTALNFYQDDELRLSMNIMSDLKGTGINDMNGELDIYDVVVNKNGNVYKIDTLALVSINEERNKDIKIESDFFDGWFKGTINPSELGTTLTRHVNQYFSLNEDTITNIADSDTAYQNFEFYLDLKKTEIITEVLVPKLETFVPGAITGSFDSRDDNLRIDIYIPKIVYTGYHIDTTYISMHSNSEQMEFEVSTTEVGDSSFQSEEIRVFGSIKNDSIYSQVLAYQNSGQVRFAIGSVLTSLEEDFRLHLLKNTIILNGENWQPDPQNYFQFTDGPIYASNVNLTHEDEFIKLNTISVAQSDSALEASFGNFDLGFINEFIKEDSTLIGGKLNGDFVLEDFSTTAFTADLRIDSLALFNKPLGTLTADAHHNGVQRFETLIKLMGQGNDVKLDGFYEAKEGLNNINFDLNMNKLTMASIEPFTFGAIENANGFIEGKLDIKGSTAEPQIRGKLQFNKAAFEVTALGTYLDFGRETIAFDKKGIHFKDVTVRDTANNPLHIDGYVYTETYTNFAFDLKVTTRNFVLMNTTETSKEPYYGTVLVSSEIDITGSLTAPVVTARVHLNEGTDVYYLVPQDDPVTVEREGIVKFVNVSDSTVLDSIMTVNISRQDTAEKGMTGLELTAEIDIDPSTDATIILDERTGEALHIKGGGALSYAMDRSGNMTLSGRYNVTGGGYDLNFYEVVQREFELVPGGSVTWSGDPLNARIDLTAQYTIRTSPAPLLTGGSTGSQQGQISRRIPFEVQINLDGVLLEPEISFGLEMEEQERQALGGAVYGRLRQLNQSPNELNKQVFALLVLGSFISDDPSAGSSNIAASTARSSVSDILTQQINQLF